MSEPVDIAAELARIEAEAKAERERYREIMRPLVERWKALTQGCPHDWQGAEGYQCCDRCHMRRITGFHRFNLWQ